jgi:hypothetical protein
VGCAETPGDPFVTVVHGARSVPVAQNIDFIGRSFAPGGSEGYELNATPLEPSREGALAVVRHERLRHPLVIALAGTILNRAGCGFARGPVVGSTDRTGALPARARLFGFGWPHSSVTQECALNAHPSSSRMGELPPIWWPSSAHITLIGAGCGFARG